MAGFTVDAHEVFALAEDLAAAAAKIIPAAEVAMVEIGKQMETQWRANATATAGAHGVHYPGTIQATTNGLVSEISPKSGQQHAMSFEEGSRNQPPHLDGQKAADVVGPVGATLLAAAVAKALP